MKIKPKGDRILVKILKSEMSSGGIILPEKFQLISSLGEVVAIGPGYLSDKKMDDGKEIWDPLESKIGDQIVFFKQAGISLSDKYRLIHDKDVLATLDKDGFEIGDVMRD